MAREVKAIDMLTVARLQRKVRAKPSASRCIASDGAQAERAQASQHVTHHHHRQKLKVHALLTGWRHGSALVDLHLP